MEMTPTSKIREEHWPGRKVPGLQGGAYEDGWDILLGDTVHPRAPRNTHINEVPPTPGLGDSWFLPVYVPASEKHSWQPGTGISS